MVKDLCFEIIQKCPNECMFCSSNANIDKNNLITFEKFKMVIDHFMTLGGIEEISLSGGEPFLHPDLFKMIAYCKNLGIRVVLFTSGVRRNCRMTDSEIDLLRKSLEEQYSSYPEEAKEFVVNRFMKVYEEYNNKEFNAISKSEMEYLKEIGLDKIVFDLQSTETDTYKMLMGKDHFDLVGTSMIRASLSGLDTDVHFIPLKKNYKEFGDLIVILNIASIHQLSILNFVPQGRGEENKDKLMLTEEEMQEFKEIFNKYKDEFEGNIRVGIPLLGEDKHKCTAGLDKLVIKYDGTVLPCPAFKEYDTKILNQMGIKTPSIYDDLVNIRVYNGTRAYPLCKKLYDFNHFIN